MEKNKKKWSEEPLSNKIVTVISVVIALAVIVLAILQIFNVWSFAVDISIPLMGLNLLCQTYIMWNHNRKAAYFNLACAIFVFICSLFVLLTKYYFKI